MAMDAIYESMVLLKCWRLSGKSRKNSFWVDYLTARVLNKVPTLSPSSEHLWLKAIADRIMEWREEERARRDRPDSRMKHQDELESLVRQISKIVVYNGYFHEPLTFFLGLRTCGSPRLPIMVMDESCGLFRDSLLAVAVYLNEVTFLQDRLDAGSKGTCKHHAPIEESGRRHHRPPFNCQPDYARDLSPRRFRSPSGEDDTRFAFGSPILIAMQCDNTKCAAALLQSLADFPSELLVCRAEMIREADRLYKLEYMHMAIQADPPFTECPEIRTLNYGYNRTRSEQAVDTFCNFFNDTTSLEVFDLLYPPMTANCRPGETPFWERYETMDDFVRWGTKRMYRAVRKGALPIVKRLVELKFSIGPQPMVEALEGGWPCMVEYFLSLGARLDGALAVPARAGNTQMVQLLLDKGAGENREGIRNAVEAAMLEGNEDMVRFLVEKTRAKGAFNKKTKANLKRHLEWRNMTEMLPLFKLL
ncbi:hypothetical protein ACHAPT_009262 [Fusarium lateritium]